MGTRTTLERFLEKVDRSGECWLWTASVNIRTGYAQFRGDENTLTTGHRWSYAHFVGEIPAGLDLDHLCRVRRCVNPAHLEPVTRSINLARGEMDRYSRLTHCKRGHEFTPQNTYTWAKRPRERQCRECMRIRGRSRSGN